MTREVVGFVLAAGLGKRLRPLTLDQPKALVPFLEVPMIYHSLSLLHSLGVKEVCINLHYLPHLLRRELASYCKGFFDISFSQEDHIQGTTGAYKYVEDWIGDRDVVALNCDVIVDIDLGKLVAKHQASSAMVTMAVLGHPHDNESKHVWVQKEDVVAIASSQCTQNASAHGYTGVQVFSPEVLTFLPSGYSEMVPSYQNIILERPGSIKASVLKSLFWFDIGTPDAYRISQQEILKKPNIFGQFDKVYGQRVEMRKNCC